MIKKIWNIDSNLLMAQLYYWFNGLPSTGFRIVWPFLVFRPKCIELVWPFLGIRLYYLPDNWFESTHDSSSISESWIDSTHVLSGFSGYRMGWGNMVIFYPLFSDKISSRRLVKDYLMVAIAQTAIHFAMPVVFLDELSSRYVLGA